MPALSIRIHFHVTLQNSSIIYIQYRILLGVLSQQTDGRACLRGLFFNSYLLPSMKCICFKAFSHPTFRHFVILFYKYTLNNNNNMADMIVNSCTFSCHWCLPLVQPTCFIAQSSYHAHACFGQSGLTQDTFHFICLYCVSNINSSTGSGI